MPPKAGVETANQVRAFEDYWALGPPRSLDKLVALYRHQSDTGQGVPTVRRRTLADWSQTYHWPEQAAQRERDEAAEVERRNRERVQKFRERGMRALEIEGSAFLQTVSGAIGPNGELGAPVVTRTMADFAKLATTYLLLAGEAQKHEVNATVDAHLQHGFGPEMLNGNPSARAAAFAYAAAITGGAGQSVAADLCEAAGPDDTATLAPGTD